MSNVKFIVWVGGVSDYEGYDAVKAESIKQEWVEQGYDDVVIEITKGGK